MNPEALSNALPAPIASAARSLTHFLEANESFSFLRLGDGEIQYLLAADRGESGPRYRTGEVRPTNVEEAFSVSGLELRHRDRLRHALENCDYLDYCDSIPVNQTLTPQLRLQRDPTRHRNRSEETSNIIFAWTETQLRLYASRHKCLFAGAESALLRELHSCPRYRTLASDYWAADAIPQFHQIRNDGRNYSENLDLIKDDLRHEITKHGIDTLFLSLATGAKILCYELATELGIRAIDFGSMTRGLAYSGSSGYQTNREVHHPFFLRVPFGQFMDSLQKAHPDLSAGQLLSKAQAQLILDLHPHRRRAFNTADSWGGQLDLNSQNLFWFRESLREYNQRYLPQATTPELAALHRAFRYWCLKQGIGWDGKLFRMTVHALSLGRGLLRRVNRTFLSPR